MLDVKLRDGRKKPGDMMVVINATNHHITFEELVKLSILLYKNEDHLYPPDLGLRGGEMLRDFMNEAFDKGDVTDDMKRRYKL
jgi:hypothetical protein